MGGGLWPWGLLLVKGAGHGRQAAPGVPDSRHSANRDRHPTADAPRGRHQCLAPAPWPHAFKRAAANNSAPVMRRCLACLGRPWRRYGTGEALATEASFFGHCPSPPGLGRRLQAGGRWFDTTFAHHHPRLTQGRLTVCSRASILCGAQNNRHANRDRTVRGRARRGAAARPAREDPWEGLSPCGASPVRARAFPANAAARRTVKPFFRAAE